MNNKRFVKGAIILIVFNLIGKIIGAIYRIPLARLVGSEGMGEYQLVFPLYSLLLTISTSGIPVAISKMVAEFNGQNKFLDSKKLLRAAVLILTVISVIGASTIVLLAKSISGIQGNPKIYLCYYGIAPAILFVGLLSAFRGYFQGNLSMTPTAISGLIEQVIKMAAGLFLTSRLISYGIEYAVLGALIGISVSEFVSCLFLVIYYFIFSAKRKHFEMNSDLSYSKLSKKLARLSLPITLGGLIAPITSIVDSLLVVNLLKFSGFSSSGATTMLGLQAGVVEPLLNVPVVISVSVSAALLPNLATNIAKKENENARALIEKAFQIVLSITFAFAICFVVFGKQILSFLYSRSFDSSELLTATKLLFLGGLNLILLSLCQVSAGVLQGLGKPKIPVYSLIVGCVIKIILNVCLISIRPIGILGAMISGAVCYGVAFFINYKKIREITSFNIAKSYFYVSIQECFVCLFAYVANLICSMVFSDIAALFVSGIITVMVFAATYYAFFINDHKQNYSELDYS